MRIIIIITVLLFVSCTWADPVREYTYKDCIKTKHYSDTGKYVGYSKTCK